MLCNYNYNYNRADDPHEDSEPHYIEGRRVDEHKDNHEVMYSEHVNDEKADDSHVDRQSAYVEGRRLLNTDEDSFHV